MYRVRPRRAQYDRFWQRQQAALDRRGPGVISVHRQRPNDPLWQDYFPFVAGTVAEKMVFAELARREVSFFFGPYWGDMPWTEDTYERYRPDFILPDYRIVIEVYGVYWHTRPGDTERDARKAMMYELAGYHYVQLWEYEIFAGVSEALNRVAPVLANPQIRTGKIFLSNRPFDPTASIVSQRRRAPKVVRKRISWAHDKYREVPAKYKVKPKLRYPKKERPEREKGFHGLATDKLLELRQTAQQWRGYIQQLDEYFQKMIDLGYEAYVKKHYWKQYKYWLRWKDWWRKWQYAAEDPKEWWDYVIKLEDFFEANPDLRYGVYREEYYRWLRWRRSGYRRL